MRSFHDFNLHEYHVICSRKEIIFKLKEHHGESEGTVICNGVIGHRFESVLEGNIISEFEEYEAQQFFREFESEIIQYQKWGLPLLCKTAAEFLNEVQQKSLKLIVISSSYGLSGWVICSSVSIIA